MNKFEQVQKGFHVCGDGGGQGQGQGSPHVSKVFPQATCKFKQVHGRSHGSCGQTDRHD